MPPVAVVLGSKSDAAAMEECLSTLERLGKAYRNIQHIHFSRCHYRRDIAAPAQGAVGE